MGNRTHVTLSILVSHKERAHPFISGYDTDEREEESDKTYYIFDEVSYGELPFLSKLRDAGIPYDSEWGSGNNFGSGRVSLRFNENGDYYIKEIYDDEINPDLETVMIFIDQPEELRKYLINHKEEVTYLSWENQEHNSKIYLTKKLITPR